MPVKTKQTKTRFAHEGEAIYLTGSENSKNEIVPFRIMKANGVMEVIGLRLDTPYVVGGKDVNGKVIPDWVYEKFLTSDYNNNRKKSQGELRADENSREEPVLDTTLN